MKRIAVVEDDIFMREELTEILRRAGYDAESVISFENAARELISSAPDLVLLDLNLPFAGGFQICRELKQKSGIPVLILTSRDQMQDELHALDLGADEYLTKPCRKERLLARISNLLRRYEGRGHLLAGADFFFGSAYLYSVYSQSVCRPPENQGVCWRSSSCTGEKRRKKKNSAGLCGEPLNLSTKTLCR